LYSRNPLTCEIEVIISFLILDHYYPHIHGATAYFEICMPLDWYILISWVYHRSIHKIFAICCLP
jgi:hypothetical protein